MTSRQPSPPSHPLEVVEGTPPALIRTEPGNAYPEIPIIMSPSQLAELLGIGRNEPYALIQTGRLRCIRLQRKILIPRAAVLEFLDGEG